LDLSASISGAGGIGGLLARTDAGGNSAFYHADGAGNITALVNGLGDLTARYLYGPFGRMTAQWGPMADANVMQFSSMPKHARSGLSLYPFRAYEPNLQRWITRDPIGELGGLNLYRSVRNSPVDTVDPFGLWEQMGLEPGPNAAADVRDAGNRIANLLGALLAKLNAELDRETQEDAQRIASFLGQGDNADTVDGIKHALDLMVVAGFPEGGEAGELGQLGKLGKIKKPCPTKFPVLGWRGSKPYRDALKKIQQGGPKVDLGFIPTKQEAEMLLEDAKATDLRPEDPHASPNPHDYPHINYTTPSCSKGTIPIR